MPDDGNISQPQQPNLPSSVIKDNVTNIPLNQSQQHGLPDRRANSDSPAILPTVTPLGPISSPSSKSSIKPAIEMEVGLPLTNPTEQEHIQPMNMEKAEDSADLKAQIQQLKDRLRDFEESGRSNTGLELKDSESDQEDLDLELWEGVSSRRANGSRGGLPPQKNPRPKTHEEMMASEALMADLDPNTRRLRHPGYASYGAHDDTWDLGEASEEELNAVPLNASQLNYVPWDNFQRLREANHPFAIDVLIGEPEPKVTPLFSGISQPNTAPNWTGQPAQAKESVALPITETPTIPVAMPLNNAQRIKMPGKRPTEGQPLLPERIRINSPAIIKLLNKIAETGDEDESHVPDSVLMMQPFRALVFYKDEIRNWKAKLEADIKEPVGAKATEVEAEPAKGVEPDDNAGPDTAIRSGEDSILTSNADLEFQNQPAEGKTQRGLSSSLNSKSAIDDITCLIEFIDTEIEGRIAYLTSNDCHKVAFSDIWLLFKPGDVVLSKDGKQAYRVINATYPKHRMKLPSARDFWRYGAKGRLEDTPIKIHCVYVDFDGKKIGPVLQSFSFHRFEGEKSVRSLDVIPLRLAKDAIKLRDTLIERGSIFIEACGTGRHGIPKHYSGLTLDTKEEVDSQVVLDFEEAFAVHDGNKRRGKRTRLTKEQLILGMMAQHVKGEIKEKGDEFIALRDLEKWKPRIKDIEFHRDIDVQKDDRELSRYSDSYYSYTDYTSSDSELGPSRPRPQPRTRPYTSPYTQPLARNLTKNLSCIPECCADELVYDDIYAERRRSNEFIHDQFRERETGSLAISSRPLKQFMEDKDLVSDSERLIVTYRVFGFIMRSKKWAQLDLTYLGPAKGETTFDLLVLPRGHRNMVESLVTQHYLDKASAFDETDEMDMVRGKGKGLIILLHGAPGVGKTTTAECVATYFQRPLFQITCGDLGSTADVVEQRLEKNFALASRWGCILLIDEADVFLEARQTENFDRNSLVAVFLRTLEYYTGILFLTTNRVGTFDEAFTSRIHISLYYPPLDATSTLAVFQVNLDRIKERFHKKKLRGVAELELDAHSINKFILNYYSHYEDARWNGRQIRNACQTALALAEFEAQKAAHPGVAGGRSVTDIVAASSKMIKVKMTDKHFRDVAKAYLAFMKYLREVHGMSAVQQAKSFRLRHDRYGLGEPSAGSGLLASRQRGYTEGDGKGGQRKPVQKQGLGRREMQRQSFGVDGGSMEDDLEDYEYGEDNFCGEGVDEDMILSMKEEEEKEDFEDEQEEDPENVSDNADVGAAEDEQAFEGDEDRYWDEQFQEDNEYRYGARFKTRSSPAGGGRGLNLRSRGQQQRQKVIVTAPPRTGGLGSGKGAATAAARSSAPPAKPPRGNHSPLGPGRGRGIVAATRGRGSRVATRHR